MLQPKTKPKTDLAALREKLRRLNVIYMNGGKTDKEYTAEVAEINALIEKAHEEEKPQENNVEEYKKLLKMDIRALYEAKNMEDKRRFWRDLIKEIHVEGNQIKDVIFF